MKVFEDEKFAAVVGTATHVKDNEDGTSAMFVPIDLCNQFSNRNFPRLIDFLHALNAELENDIKNCF
ncbi:hypothetical protein TYRP_015429 [Tyrophagus putrescentiae]|nr:hypothetical protein TYRP_015429 [Tyrophagus putrescentiae]